MLLLIENGSRLIFLGKGGIRISLRKGVDMLSQKALQLLIEGEKEQPLGLSSLREQKRNSESYRKLLLSEAKRLQTLQQKRNAILLRQFKEHSK